METTVGRCTWLSRFLGAGGLGAAQTLTLTTGYGRSRVDMGATRRAAGCPDEAACALASLSPTTTWMAPRSASGLEACLAERIAAYPAANATLLAPTRPIHCHPSSLKCRIHELSKPHL
ncbi:hypothetical protein BKA70DRAFT_1262799, partial [Coprinopsis sp. MPI-PUGE-AT-0042]